MIAFGGWLLAERGSPPLWMAGCLLGASGVLCGAFGAHALKRIISPAAPHRLRSWETAAHYQLFHAGPLLLSAALADGSPACTVGGWLICAGSVLFSGSIYALVLRPQWRTLGPVTPLGGLLLVSGWLSLAFGGIVQKSP